ncbi:hypothetical protein [Streptomyces mutabilis]|uniref:Uncharacterized protein n=1 Tax=Streptomyces mutabilis TaxID=67332 RepID=A0A086N737_9ACTN|nr:hypothetical protein [Streptomyces mutabilis]KFG76955.1 hypothetical protein FM21_13010 [Streptomyces mutabilis]
MFFDHLRVPWAYEPVTFYDSQDSSCTPAFWLPEQRIWFAAEREAPVWWGRFAMAAEGSDYWGGSWGEEAGRCLPVGVPEEWQGLTLLSEGPFFPDDDPGIDSWGRPDPCGGPWRFHEATGMRTYDDEPYQWTMCPQCGSFGAEFCGYAERLSCGCLDDRENSKVANGSDKRLLAAYRAAQLEQWHADDFTDPHATVLWPTVREALVHQPGAAAAAANCAGECRSLAEQLRQEQCPPAAGEGEGLETLCSACPGFVCGQCGERPASAAGVPCRTCEPVVLLTENQARQRLNWRVEQLAAATGIHGRRVKRHRQRLDRGEDEVRGLAGSARCRAHQRRAVAGGPVVHADRASRSLLRGSRQAARGRAAQASGHLRRAAGGSAARTDPLRPDAAERLDGSAQPHRGNG